MKLREAVDIVKQIEEEVKVGRKSMMNVGSLSVDAIRTPIGTLDDIKETIMGETIVTNRSLENLLIKYRDCMRECLEPFYRKKYPPTPEPIPEIWKEQLPVTVTAVHLMIYLDISDSMFSYGGFKIGGVKRTLVQNFINTIKKRLDEEAAKGNPVPFKVSLIGYADPSDTKGHNRKDGSTQRFWEIVMDKSIDVTSLSSNIGTINRSAWVKGQSKLEEGLSCVYHTIDSLVDKTVVNGKPTENIVVLISDERQRTSDGTGSHKNYKKTVSTTAFSNKMKSLGIKNIFGMLPFSTGYNYNGYTVSSTSPTKTVSWNSGIRKLFRNTKEYWKTTQVSQMDNWVRWILNPESFGQ